MRKINLIINITSQCNHNCSYCDVIKNNKSINDNTINDLIKFVKNNSSSIDSIKFFWWEPLLHFEKIKIIIDSLWDEFYNKYKIVTNSSLLNKTWEIWEYFNKYFRQIFISINSEYKFNFNEVKDFIIKNNIDEKTFFNTMIEPWKEILFLKDFIKLKNFWFNKFNILPIFFTKSRTKKNLLNFSKILKIIFDNYLIKDRIQILWYNEWKWNKFSLYNDAIFIDTDWSIYYTDIVTTNLENKIKQKLYIWNISNIKIEDIINNNFESETQIIYEIQNKKILDNLWQSELHKIMEYLFFYKNINKTKRWLIEI